MNGAEAMVAALSARQPPQLARVVTEELAPGNRALSHPDSRQVGHAKLYLSATSAGQNQVQYQWDCAMNIGEASKAAGVSAKMIRHYESVGLVPQARRTDSGYRQYADGDIHTLRFIRHARDLGFSIPEIAELVGLWQNRRRPSRLVKELAQAHILELEQKTQELLAMKATLEHLVHCCHGDDRPDCPILESLASDASIGTATRNPRMAVPNARRLAK